MHAVLDSHNSIVVSVSNNSQDINPSAVQISKDVTPLHSPPLLSTPSPPPPVFQQTQSVMVQKPDQHQSIEAPMQGPIIIGQVLIDFCLRKNQF